MFKDAILTNISDIPIIAGALAICPTVYAAFAWAEDRVAAKYKSGLSALVLRQGHFANEKLYFSKILNSIFGEKLFCLKAIFVTYLISILSFGSYLLGSDGTLAGKVQVCFIFSAIWIFPPTYLGIVVLKLVHKYIPLRNIAVFWILLFIIDCFTRINCTVIASRAKNIMYPDNDPFAFLAIFTIFGGIMSSTIICWLLILAVRATFTLSNFLDIDKQPLRSLGIVVSIFASTGYILIVSIDKIGAPFAYMAMPLAAIIDSML